MGSQQDDRKVVVKGRFVRIAKVDSEFYTDIDDPVATYDSIRRSHSADIFSFIQPLSDVPKESGFTCEYDSIAVVPISSFDHWWTKQINDKTRNMIRKAKKAGVEIRRIKFDDELVAGIKSIYDEVEVKQGKANKHYGKSLEQLKREHSSFLDRSEFVGAFFENKLIGFAKITFTRNRGVLMNIAAFVSHRDKAPSNALIAEAVTLCAERAIPYLQYGVWSKRGLGNFKKHHAFQRLDIPRYYVPLTAKGRLALALSLHRSFKERIPERFLDFAIELRSKWIAFRIPKQTRTATGL